MENDDELERVQVRIAGGAFSASSMGLPEEEDDEEEDESVHVRLCAYTGEGAKFFFAGVG